MKEVFICFHGRHGLDELEDAIEGALGELGEVTGTGAGEAGSNIDVEVLSGDADEVVARITGIGRGGAARRACRIDSRGIRRWPGADRV